MLRRLVETLVLPPASVLLLLLLGTMLRRRWPRCGRLLQVAGALLLLLLSLPVVGGALLESLQRDPPLPADGPLPAADAIVVLSADGDRHGREYGRAVVGPMTLQRLRYAAALQRRTGLPLLVSGGVPDAQSPPLAAMMAAAARDEFGVPVRWVEDRSGDTWQNAAESARLLRAAGVQRVLLVTSAWHMPRAAASCRAHGLEVVPAPTAFRAPAAEGWTVWLPHWAGLRDSCLALHEYAGRIAYWFRG
ncbi:MAG: YdcF family protein [Planctomycetes bacterium]|nr:YdcF family protein [Planctomycetota bacterium]